jgi:prepilin-type N-terminal cleavage/methylation domain-containing protein
MRMLTKKPAGFTLVELLMIVALIGIVSAIAVPGLMRARQSGNEASAISALRTIVSAQYMYGATCGGGFFAPRLTALGTAPPGGSPFVGPDLGAANVAVKGSYTIEVGSTNGGDPTSPASCNGQAAGLGTVGYWGTATPTAGAGARSFGVNTLTTIYSAPQQTPVMMTDSTFPAGAAPISQ